MRSASASPSGWVEAEPTWARVPSMSGSPIRARLRGWTDRRGWRPGSSRLAAVLLDVQGGQRLDGGPLSGIDVAPSHEVIREQLGFVVSLDGNTIRRITTFVRRSFFRDSSGCDRALTSHHGPKLTKTLVRWTPLFSQMVSRSAGCSRGEPKRAFLLLTAFSECWAIVRSWGLSRGTRLMAAGGGGWTPGPAMRRPTRTGSRCLRADRGVTRAGWRRLRPRSSGR